MPSNKFFIIQNGGIKKERKVLYGLRHVNLQTRAMGEFMAIPPQLHLISEAKQDWA